MLGYIFKEKKKRRGRGCKEKKKMEERNTIQLMKDLVVPLADWRVLLVRSYMYSGFVKTLRKPKKQISDIRIQSIPIPKIQIQYLFPSPVQFTAIPIQGSGGINNHTKKPTNIISRSRSALPLKKSIQMHHHWVTTSRLP